MRNVFLEKINHLTIRDFWMVKIWPYFHKSIWVEIFILFFNCFCPKSIILENFRWNIIAMDLVGFLLGCSNKKNDINYNKYNFSHIFGKVYRWLNIYYLNIKIIIFKKLTTMSIWIILKNIVWIFRKCSFSRYWTIVPCIHPMWIVP
jgi:hypothetical protein